MASYLQARKLACVWYRVDSNPAADAVLEDLYRQRLFTDRHAGDDPSFRYHALFGEFLRGRAEAAHKPKELRRLKTLSAQVLEGALVLVGEARVLAAGTVYRHHESLMLMVQAHAHEKRGDSARARAVAT